MRFLAASILLGWLLAAPGCGGGSSVGTDADPLVLTGKLVTRDGTTTDLAGVVVLCDETGDRDTTRTDGAFRVQVPHDGPFHLDFDDPSRPTDAPYGHPTGEHGDPRADGVEVDGPGVRLDTDRPYDRCEVEVHLADGEIVECHVRWGDAQGETHDGEQRMERDPLCDELGAMGEVEITVDEGCLGVEIEIEGLSGTATLDVALVDLEGEEAWLATVVLDDSGAGHLELSWCDGDPLPLDAASIEDLAGFGIVVYDEAGDVVLRGHIPHHHAHDEAHHHGGEGGGGGGHGHGPHRDA